jgi:peptidoglycan hydrolase-like protein with peptidoglycan-binding domain
MTLAPANEAQRASVRQAQRVLRIDETGDMDSETKASLRALQALFRLPVTGILDAATAIKIEQIRNQFA